MTMDFSFSSHTPIDGIFGETRISAIIYSFVIVLAIVPVCIWYTIAEGTAGNRAISYLISLYLCWRYPIKSTDGKTPLPTASYTFPNGQGNVAKFLEGEEGSRKWQQQLGSMYRIWTGFDSEVVLMRPEQVQTVFKDSHLHVKGESMDSGWLCGQVLGNCLGLLNQGEWDTVRAPFVNTFHRNQSSSYIPLIQRRVERHFNKLEEAKEQSDKFLLVNPSKHLKLLPLWILCDVIYGDLTAAMELQFQEIIPLRETLWCQIMNGGVSRFSLSRFLPISTNKKLKMFKEKWTRFNDQAYERAKQAYPSHPIVGLYDAVEQGVMSKTQLLHTLDEALFANLDVTIGNFSWIPLFLAAHQDVQDDLRMEISAARKEDTEDLWTRYITGSSTLLMACVLESARLKPMAPFSIPQAAPTDRVVDNFVIPAGTNFIVDTYALNVLDPYWGKDNTQYRPRRFLETKSAGEMRYRFWRYGFGPRQCLGKNVADVVLKVLLTHMVENYRLRLSAGDGTNIGDWERVVGSWISSSNSTIICERVN
ncbi:hypothetical protein H634G_09920 [Metarhizium anisopliae BRIP 53293]|uniref:Cytochrome P450 n=1 Tax=Metarhizium anisopliae BRIP 53293 TaxID=1291518 RepID=A0A0D9NLU5_METAN|nr:hypothetical protein H634G_09920 [Metarhizium anisopliae BRIP 53293]KJK94801.1 hypothetical protein H633G_01311 [Metarhizium anisopliae BRIP 53284]